MGLNKQDGHQFMEGIIQSMQSKLQAYEETLKFYADSDSTWHDGEYIDGEWTTVAEKDGGLKARAVLNKFT